MHDAFYMSMATDVSDNLPNLCPHLVCSLFRLMDAVSEIKAVHGRWVCFKRLKMKVPDL
jgi:hypothetical protein